MRIAFLNAYGNGSTGRIVDSLLRKCKENGDETISIFAREFNPMNTPNTIQCHNKFDFYLDALLTRVFDNHGLNNYFNTKRIINILKEFNPDIIHIHNLHGYWINYKMLFKYIKNNSIKVVWTFHDCWHFTGHCTHFEYVKCDKWQTCCHSCPQLSEYPKASVFDGSKRSFKEKKNAFTSIKNMVIVTPSEWLADKVRQSFLKGYEVKVINNGINLNVFKHLETAKRDDFLKKGFEKIVLGVSGDWNERKGLKYIVEVAKKMPRVLFVVIGRTNEKIELENIYYVARTENQKELAEWYSAADVFINPTLEDTYPTTNLEAIACGTPVVTFPTGGSIEIVKLTGFGEICKKQNSESLIESLEIAFSKKYNRMDFSMYLDAQVKFNEYLSLYDKERGLK